MKEMIAPLTKLAAAYDCAGHYRTADSIDTVVENMIVIAHNQGELQEKIEGIHNSITELTEELAHQKELLANPQDATPEELEHAERSVNLFPNIIEAYQDFLVMKERELADRIKKDVPVEHDPAEWEAPTSLVGIPKKVVMDNWEGLLDD